MSSSNLLFGFRSKRTKGQFPQNVDPNAVLSPKFRTLYDVEDHVEHTKDENKQIEDLMQELNEEEPDIKPVSTPTFFQILGTRGFQEYDENDTENRPIISRAVFRCVICFFATAFAAGLGVLAATLASS